jgi:hypothetical protein
MAKKAIKKKVARNHPSGLELKLWATARACEKIFGADWDSVFRDIVRINISPSSQTEVRVCGDAIDADGLVANLIPALEKALTERLET